MVFGATVACSGQYGVADFRITVQAALENHNGKRIRRVGLHRGLNVVIQVGSGACRTQRRFARFQGRPNLTFDPGVGHSSGNNSGQNVLAAWQCSRSGFLSSACPGPSLDRPALSEVELAANNVAVSASSIRACCHFTPKVSKNRHL